MTFCVNWKEPSAVKKVKVVHAQVMIRKFQPFSALPNNGKNSPSFEVTGEEVYYD